MRHLLNGIALQLFMKYLKNKLNQLVLGSSVCLSVCNYSHIKLKKPVWPQRRSHCSVIYLAHVWEPFVALSGAKIQNGSVRWARLITELIVPFQWHSSRWSHYGCTHTNLRELMREPYVWMASLAPSKAPLVLCVLGLLELRCAPPCGHRTICCAPPTCIVHHRAALCTVVHKGYLSPCMWEVVHKGMV